MGHIGAGGVDAHFRNQAGGRNPNKQKRFVHQDPDMNVSPMLNRSDSFSSFTGKHANFSSTKAVANRHGDDQIVCKREAFYVVEDRPVVIARTQFIREHRLYEVEFVKETYFNKERELMNDRPEEIVEQKERIVSVTTPNPCSCVTGNEYSIGGMSGLPGEAAGYSSLPRSRRGSGQELF